MSVGRGKTPARAISFYQTASGSLDLLNSSDGSDEQLLVITVYYSHWSEVAIIGYMKAKNVIRCIMLIMIMHGISITIHLDNGLQFISQEFNEFCTEYRIEHISMIPYWPPANGEVRYHTQTLLKAFRITKIEKHEYH